MHVFKFCKNKNKKKTKISGGTSRISQSKVLNVKTGKPLKCMSLSFAKKKKLLFSD